MKKQKLFLILLLFIFSAINCFSQESGIIYYDEIHNWSKKRENCKYLPKSQRENSSYVWGQSEYTQKATLKFNKSATLFENIEDEAENREWSRRKTDFYIYRDLEKNEMLDIKTVLDKDYAIVDSIHCLNWKIRNDMKEIAGHICMNAYYYDTLRDKEIIAWFALDMPISIGPDGYCGLPGAILELNMNKGSLVYTATSIIPSENLKIEKPTYKKNRKEINFAELSVIEEKAILEAIKMKRPYFWQLSY